MSKEAVNLSGPEVILFIQDHQKTPHLLEELSAIVLKAEQEHQQALGVNTLNVPYLKNDQLENKTQNQTHDGYLLRVCLIKEDDAKDPTGWKELIYFLPTDDEGKIDTIVVLGEAVPNGVLSLDELGEADQEGEEGTPPTVH